MTQLNCYLNFKGTTEEAFNFYKSVFGGDFMGGVMRFRDVTDLPGKENFSEKDLNAVLHVALTVGSNVLMGSDVVEGHGDPLQMGNNVQLSLHADSREEADRLYKALSAGGRQTMPLQDMFWGDYWGTLTDKFGIVWMISFHKR